jgi:SAM-dependent methyltransferase
MGDFIRYLLAKRSVDDRALSRRVWERLERELRKLGGSEIRIVDIGAGVGTGAERMSEWRLFEPLSAIRYTGLEPREELLHEARRRLPSPPFPVELAADTLDEFAARRENRGRFDLVVAHALLDLLDLAPALEALASLARPGGLLYLPITFDGETIFEPGSDADDAVVSAYHDDMENKGTSRSGRRLFHALTSLGIDVLEIGSSDWIVYPRGGGYPEDEAFFLQFLLSTIERAVRGRVEPATIERWISERRRQLASAELFYCVHQLDALARKPR